MSGTAANVWPSSSVGPSAWRSASVWASRSAACATSAGSVPGWSSATVRYMAPPQSCETSGLAVWNVAIGSKTPYRKFDVAGWGSTTARTVAAVVSPLMTNRRDWPSAASADPNTRSATGTVMAAPPGAARAAWGLPATARPVNTSKKAGSA